MIKNRQNKKMTFLGFVSHEQVMSVVCLHLYLRYWSNSVKFCYGDNFADTPAKGAFLTLTTESVPICKGENFFV